MGEKKEKEQGGRGREKEVMGQRRGIVGRVEKKKKAREDKRKEMVLNRAREEKAMGIRVASVLQGRGRPCPRASLWGWGCEPQFCKVSSLARCMRPPT